MEINEYVAQYLSDMKFVIQNKMMENKLSEEKVFELSRAICEIRDWLYAFPEEVEKEFMFDIKEK